MIKPRRPCFLLLALALAGCHAGGRGAYQPQAEAARDPQRAQELTMQAADLVASEPARAERLLREALTADLYHGPAHNNLGVVFLNAGRLYEAASEFQWARRLMPGHPEPRLNLGVALERAGKVDDAIDAFETALDVHPNHLAAVQALARCQIRHRRTNERTQVLLGEIAMRGDAQWRSWAQTQMTRLDAPLQANDRRTP